MSDAGPVVPYAPLTPAEPSPFRREAEFRQWYDSLSKKLHLDPNPDAAEHFYDHRAFYRDMKAGKPGVISPDQPGGHFPSDYKLPGHPREHLQDPTTGKVFNTQTGQYVGGGQVPQGAMDASQDSPDMPGFRPDLARQLANIKMIFRR